MNAQLLSDFPSDAQTRGKSSNKPMPDKSELLAKHSFPGPDDNRFITAQLQIWKAKHEARGH